MNAARPVGQHHGDLRTALLAAALELVDDGGPEKVTLRAMARRAGVSPGAPYHHFDDKAAVLAAVALDGFEQLADQQRRVTEADPTTRLRRLLVAYLEFALANHTHYRIMFGETGTAPAFDDPAVKIAAMATFDELRSTVAEIAGHDDIDDTATAIWALAHGAVAIAVMKVPDGAARRHFIDDIARRAVDLARA